MPITTYTFQQGATVSGGPFNGSYLWSNQANWTNNSTPTDDDDVSNAANGFNLDDIDGLTLNTLTQTGDGATYVVAPTLGVKTVVSTGFLAADAFLAEAAVTVTIGDITLAGGVYNADGAGATLIDNSTVDQGEFFDPDTGGMIELAAAPAATSTFDYLGAGTIALENPSATTTATFENVGVGDTLELPGASVTSVNFGASSLTVTTNVGSYAFTNVNYVVGAGIDSYGATFDSSTGLVAVHFGVTETFQSAQAASSGEFSGYYLWSNSANWTSGTPPNDDDSVSNASRNFNLDDIDGLTLDTLTQTDEGSTTVVAPSLAVTTVTSNGSLVADAYLAGAAVTVTIGDITLAGGLYNADGAGATLIDNSSIDQGEYFDPDTGGMIELAAAPAATSTFDYLGAGTIALENPGATTAATFENVGVGDVLELPGTAVNNVSFGGSSLTVTTNAGSYAFTNVNYEAGAGIDSYGATFDSDTGLVAVHFGVTETFQSAAAAPNGEFNGYYLWSTSANWASGSPPNNDDSVSNASDNFNADDIDGLTLDTLTQTDEGSTTVVAPSLIVNTVTSDGTLVADAFLPGAPVTVTIGNITLAGGVYIADGAGARLIDNSPTDQGEYFFIDPGGIVELAAAPAATSVFDYEDAPGAVALEDPGATTTAALKNVGVGDVLELPGNAVTSVSFGANSLTVATNLGSYAFTNVTYNTTIAAYTASQDASTGLEAITFAVCYLRGTHILTPNGEVLIEDLRIGDLVVTASGEHRPIKWLGRRPIDCTRHPDPESVWPVCIQQGALGEGKPTRDLWVTRGHSLLFDDVLIQAEKLINGVTIFQQPRDKIEIWHVELDSHDIILAEGAPAESYLDTGNRTSFVGGGAFLELHPDFQPKRWSETCAPLVFDGPKLARAKASILEIAARHGHVITADADAHIVADGKRFEPVWLDEARLAFMLPAGCSTIALRSRGFVPIHCQPLSQDERWLGVAVGRLQIDGADVAIDDDAVLLVGWHGFERHENGHCQRWTNGDTPLPANARLIVIDIAARGYYWAERQAQPSWRTKRSLPAQGA